LSHGTSTLRPVGNHPPLVLDNETFRRGFLSARQWYVADIDGEDGRAPQEPHHNTTLTSEEVPRLVVMPDDQGFYHFDEIGYENLASIPGLSRWRAFVAHLSPREAKHFRKEQVQQEYLRRSVPA
jgi:hypothetical protein